MAGGGPTRCPGRLRPRALERLGRVLAAIPNLKLLRYGSPEFEKWHRDARVAISHTFDESPSRIRDFEDIQYFLSVVYSGIPEYERQEAYVRGLDSAAAILESMIDEVEEYWEDEDRETKHSEVSKKTSRINANQVFIIHGSDHGTRDRVARFLESLRLEVVILQEQPDQGRTVIEKFEQCAEGDFAVALFTPDDVGGRNDGGLQPRARQNVIFEFGYFVGKFGRDRVRALVKGNPEIPSDYSGVIYISLDDGDGWKMALVRELKNAGFTIDANLAFSL